MQTRLIFLFTIAFSFFGCHTTKNTVKTEDESVKNIPISDNSENSLNWNGVYRGTLPCADCEGIQTVIILNKDLTYQITRKYLGKDVDVFNTNGTFKWNEDGSKISLQNFGHSIETSQYQVGENVLIKLDINDKKIEGALSEMYLLKKEEFDKNIAEKYWKLIELRDEIIPVNENPKREAHFVLKTENNSLVGNGGCNWFHGSFELSDANRIKFSKMAATKMACMGIEYESEFLNVFNITDNYTFIGDTLLLNDANRTTLAKFKFVYLK